MIKIVGIIPCRLNSTRLPRKNLQKIGNQTLLEITIEYLLASDLIDEIAIFTDDLDDAEIKEHAANYPDIRFALQPRNADWILYERFSLLYSHIYRKYYAPAKTLFVTAACDNPIKPDNLDNLISKSLNDNLDELIVFMEGGNSNGGLHIISHRALKTNEISGHTSYSLVKGIDIHTQNDLEKARLLCTPKPVSS